MSQTNIELDCLAVDWHVEVASLGLSMWKVTLTHRTSADRYAYVGPIGTAVHRAFCGDKSDE